LNDARDPAQRAAGIYHWTPSIADYTDPVQEQTYALAGLDDLDTEHPAVRRALRDAYGHWIREAGVDAFRVDTAYHVPAEFFPDFLHAADPAAPGVARVAADTGRDDFLAFGEGFGPDRAFEDAHARKLDAYMRVPGGLPAMIDFPLYGTLGDVFARGRPSGELGYRIERRMALHADPWRMPTFVDNHDVDRFLAGGSEAGLKQALLALMTLPGIPVIYYGTEQGFSERRASMFAGGHGSGGVDHFDTTSPMYRYLQRAIALRRGNRVFSRGTPTVLASNAAAPERASAFCLAAPSVRVPSR
jgi:glycosidase